MNSIAKRIFILAAAPVLIHGVAAEAARIKDLSNVRGVRENGRPLEINRDYLRSGLRIRSQEIATRERRALVCVPNCPPLVAAIGQRFEVELVATGLAGDGVDITEVISRLSGGPRMILLQTVTNPWGRRIREADLARLIGALPEDCYLVLDECHDAFGPAVPLTPALPELVFAAPPWPPTPPAPLRATLPVNRLLVTDSVPATSSPPARTRGFGVRNDPDSEAAAARQPITSRAWLMRARPVCG